MTILLWTLVALLVFLGILGTFLPGMAGAPLVFLGLLLAAWIEDFEQVGVVTVVLLGLLTLFSTGIDILATTLGAKRVGASRLAIIGAAVGAVAGLFFGLPGIILGPLIGAAGGEYATRRELIRAGKVGLGTWLGLVVGAAARVALLFAILGIFLAAYIL